MAELFLSCDWGTSNFRLQLVRAAELAVLAERRTGEGIGAIAAQAATPAARAAACRALFHDAVAALARESGRRLGRVPAVISGMASASIGWQELPYARVPFALDGSGVVARRLPGGVHLLSGLRTERDVMRGEETQVLGLLAAPELAALAADCLVVLPGTHSKHVRVHAGQVTHFQTYMTGELFAVLSQHSILRHSVAAADDATPATPAATAVAFQEGVRLAAQQELPAGLFQVRAGQVLSQRPLPQGRAMLSGLLIGAEWRGLLAAAPTGVPVLLAASAALGPPYLSAARALGLGARVRSVGPADLELALRRAQAQFLARVGRGETEAT